MSAAISRIAWVLGLVATCVLIGQFVYLGWDDGDYRFMAWPLLPAALLWFGTWPMRGMLWPRRVAFWLGLALWLYLILGCVFGLFNAAFRLDVLFAGGAAIILLAMYAPRAARA